MRTFMPTLLCLALSTAPAALAQTSADALISQLARLSGTHLAFSDCQARMTDMETMLGASGYGPRATRTGTNGSVYAGWYHAARHLTVMAVAAPNDDGRGYGLYAYTVAGQVRGNDYLPMP